MLRSVVACKKTVSLTGGSFLEHQNVFHALTVIPREIEEVVSCEASIQLFSTTVGFSIVHDAVSLMWVWSRVKVGACLVKELYAFRRHALSQ